MNRRLWHFGIALLWAVIPAIYFQYQSVWNRLPVRMATHFNASGQPNGWATRESSMWFIVGVAAFVVVLATILLARIRRPDVASWGVLFMFGVTLAILYMASGAVIGYNLSGTSVKLDWAMKVLVGAVAVIILLSVIPKRGAPLEQSDLVAEEMHGSMSLALIFVVAALAEVAAAFVVHIPVARLVLLAAATLFIAIATMTASGFQYQFRLSGVEVRAFGFRLRSIPIAQIENYAIQPWSLARGYGIRIGGNSRAYVWGNRVVRIKTNDGEEIFLGHSHPERIVRDLDTIMRLSHS